jgi:osmoprotectant transport system permease protein
MIRLAAALMAAGLLLPPQEETLRIGHKNFAENELLAEMFARVIADRTGLRVERLRLADTLPCFEALKAGQIAAYPEYTGTGLVEMLGEAPVRSRREALYRVRTEFQARWDLWWLAPLGFNNAYELAVPRQIAERHNLRTISDLAKVAPQLRAAVGFDFATREDGLPGLRKVYGMEFKEVRQMQQNLKYQAAGERAVDCIDVYTTDGLLLVHDLVVLEDDRKFFPPYEAAPLVRGDVLRRRPEVGAALGLLAGALDEARMRRLNRRVQEDREPVERVAQEALEELGMLAARKGSAPTGRSASFLRYLVDHRSSLAAQTAEHLALSGAGLLLGVLVAMPLAFLLERRRALAEPVIRAVSLTQTIPSLALLAFMIPLFGIGPRPAILALWIYSIFPVLRNAYTGLRDADPRAVEAATALGMTGTQVLWSVRLPLAAPVIMAGVRTAAVLTVGTATLAAFVGAGGLGEPIVSGLQKADPHVILSGALPAAALALLVDAVLGAAERLVRPRGLERHR